MLCLYLYPVYHHINRDRQIVRPAFELTERRTPLLMAISKKTRAALLVLWIIVLATVALLLIRDRRPSATASMPPPTTVPAASRPAGIQRTDIQTSRAEGTGTVEVCGYGRVPIDKTDPSAIFQRVGALTKEAGTRWLSALQNSGDLRARAAGLMLEGKVTGDGSGSGGRNGHRSACGLAKRAHTGARARAACLDASNHAANSVRH
jgi:hypothetical protein